VNRAIFVSNEKYVVTTSEDKTVRIWDIQSGGEQGMILGTHLGGVIDINVSHRGDSLVTTSSDGVARIWSANADNNLIELTGHAAPVLSANFSADDKYLITASGDGTVKIWYTRTGKLKLSLKGFGGSVLGATFSANSNSVVYLLDYKAIVTVDLGSLNFL